MDEELFGRGINARELVDSSIVDGEAVLALYETYEFFTEEIHGGFLDEEEAEEDPDPMVVLKDFNTYWQSPGSVPYNGYKTFVANLKLIKSDRGRWAVDLR